MSSKGYENLNTTLVMIGAVSAFMFELAPRYRAPSVAVASVASVDSVVTYFRHRGPTRAQGADAQTSGTASVHRLLTRVAI